MSFNFYICVYIHIYICNCRQQSEIDVRRFKNRSLLTYRNIFQKLLGSTTLKKIVLFGNNFKLIKNYENKNSPRGTHKFFTQITCCSHPTPFAVSFLYLYIQIQLYLYIHNVSQPVEAELFQLKSFLLKMQLLWPKEWRGPGVPPPWLTLATEVVIPLNEIFEKQWKPLLSSHCWFPKTGHYLQRLL